MSNKRVLVVGSGGREHALAWLLSQSAQVYIAPGNAGTESIGQNVPIDPSDIESLLQFAIEYNIDLTVVGPENALGNGIVDIFDEAHKNIFGPTADAADIENSKVLGKGVMVNAGIQTAPFKIFRDYDNALQHLHQHGVPIVVKASGPALGKGVSPCKTFPQAEKALQAIMLDGKHGGIEEGVILEDYLEGIESSIHALCDGKDALPFPPAKDHKAVWNGNKGPNTGGMGTVAPASPLFNMEDAKRDIIDPTLAELKKLGTPFKGCLFPGIMLSDGVPNVLEYNSRFGDPETQVYMRLLENDLYDLLMACVCGNLHKTTLTWKEKYAACIVLASDGYPGSYEKGKLILGVPEAEELEDIVVFHAGTKTTEEGLVTSGGRVLNVTAIGDTQGEALRKAYEAVGLISFEGMHYRTDIGW